MSFIKKHWKPSVICVVSYFFGYFVFNVSVMLLAVPNPVVQFLAFVFPISYGIVAGAFIEDVR